MISSLLIVLTLVVMEGLLSVDNALVLAVMVGHLPHDQQKKALFYGLIGAYAFRLIAILLGSILIKITWIKLVGGLYLMWLVIKYFIDKNNKEDKNNDGIQDSLQKSFWATVISVELMDMAFSIDSILAAFGVAEKVWILFVGGCLGILMMRGISQVFVKLIEKVPELETTAYVLIAFISLKMIGSTFGYHINEVLFFIIIFSAIGLTFVINKIKKQNTYPVTNHH